MAEITSEQVQREVAKVLDFLNAKSAEGGATSVVTQHETVQSSMSFTLPAYLSLNVFAEGLLLQAQEDYTVSSRTVTLTQTWPTGTKVTFEMVTKGSQITHHVKVGTATKTVELPNPPQGLAVYIDGVLSQFGETYTYSGQTVTFVDTIPVDTVLSFVITL